MILPSRKRQRLFYGWWILTACSFFNFFVGGTFHYGFTAFFNPLREELGWSSAQTALGFSLHRLEAGIAAPVVGFIFDRIGPRRLISIGMIVAGSGLIYMSRIQSLTSFYLAFLVIAVGVSLSWIGPPMYVIANWFIRKRSRALSILMAGTGLGGLLVPVLVLLIARLGWRMSLMLVGIGFLILSIPLTIIIKHRPEQCGCLPDGDTIITSSTTSTHKTPGNQTNHDQGFSTVGIDIGIMQALKSSSFWLLSLTFALSQFVATAVMVLEIPYLESIDISRRLAGLVVTFTTLLTLVGSLASGFLGDSVKKKYVIAGAITLQCLGMLIFANVHQSWQLTPFVIVYSLGYGATIPMRPALIADYFGRANIGAILGVLASITLIVSVLSPLLAGWFFDLRGSYRDIFSIYALILSIAIPAALAVR